jgi:Mg-chelatase subunit ChlD
VQARVAPRARTTGRAELDRHPHFAQVSPQVGVLDPDALRDALAADPDAVLALLAAMSGATDEALRSQVRRLAPGLVLDRVRSGRARRRGTGRPRTVRASQGGDLDLDASLDAVAAARAQSRPPHLDDLVARDWGRPDLALCLLVDRSGSMQGARLAGAAVTAAACALRAPAEHAVLAFARDTVAVRHLRSARSAEATVEAVLRLQGHGVTALAAALRRAHDELATARATRRVVVLLSDCRSTDDEDPLPAARRVPELVVLAPAADEAPARSFAIRAGARFGCYDHALAAPGLLTDLLGRPGPGPAGSATTGP